jgi:hypothetical protein
MKLSSSIRHSILPAFLLPAFFASNSAAQTTGTTSLSLTVAASASITISTGTTTLTAASATAPYTGTTAFTFLVRTSQLIGLGTIQVKITSDFSPSNGPSVASPPTVGDTLSYTCTATIGTACLTSTVASTLLNTTVVSFGADIHSLLTGSSGTTVWSLTNDPAYKSGTYTATATYTISVT